MSIEAWADAARHKYRQNAEHQRAMDTLQFLLEGKIDSDSGAGTIASIYEPLLKRDASRSGVGTFWAIICNLVRGFGGNKDVAERLVGLLNSISKLPDVRDEHGMAITPAWSSAGVYWRGLPVLTMIFREYAIG